MSQAATSAFSTEEISKLEKVLGLLSSAQDGEALSALRMAQRILTKHNVTWIQFIQGMSRSSFGLSKSSGGQSSQSSSGSSGNRWNRFYEEPKQQRDPNYDDLMREFFRQSQQRQQDAYNAASEKAFQEQAQRNREQADFLKQQAFYQQQQEALRKTKAEQERRQAEELLYAAYFRIIPEDERFYRSSDRRVSKDSPPYNQIVLKLRAGVVDDALSTFYASGVRFGPRIDDILFQRAEEGAEEPRKKRAWGDGWGDWRGVFEEEPPRYKARYAETTFQAQKGGSWSGSIFGDIKVDPQRRWRNGPTDGASAHEKKRRASEEAERMAKEREDIFSKAANGDDTKAARMRRKFKENVMKYQEERRE